MNPQRWMTGSSTGQLHCGLVVCIIATLVANSMLFSRFPAPAVRSRLLLISAMSVCYWSFQASECISCRSVDVYACHGAEVFRSFHFVKALEARMLNARANLVWQISLIAWSCFVYVHFRIAVSRISVLGLQCYFIHVNLLSSFQRSLQLAFDRFCHGLLSYLQLEFIRSCY